MESFAYGVMGMTPDTFWGMTPREYALAVKGWHDKRKAEHNETAWHTCNIMNSSGFLREPVRYEDLCVAEQPTREQKFARVKQAFEEALDDDGG